jgi:hypothetical protein
MTMGASCHRSPPTQEIFQFDAIMDVRGAARPFARHRPTGARVALSGARGSITHVRTNYALRP